MKIYTAENYRLYIAADNATNFMVLDSKTEDKYLVFDWDLTDEQQADIAMRFYSKGLTSDCFANDKWMDGDMTDAFKFWKEADQCFDVI